MADNIELNAGSGGSTLAAAELAISGDTAIVQMVGCGILSGSEGSWTHSQLVGGAGAVVAGVQRVTLASDDPAVALLGTIDTDTSAMTTSLGNLDNAVDGNYLNVNLNFAGTDATAGEGVITAQTQRVTIATDDDGVAHLATIAGDTTSLDGKITACDTSGVVISSGTVTTVSSVTAIANALPAGDNNIGNVDIASSVALDVSAATVTVSATQLDIDSLDKDDDEVLVWANTAKDGTGTDYVPLVDADGHLQVDVLSGGGSNASVFVDDAAFTLTSSSLTVAGGIRDDSLSTLSAVEGDAVPLRVNSTGALHVTGAGGGTQYQIDDAGGATDTGTLALAIRDDSLTTLTPVDGDYVGLRVNSTGALHVTGGGGGTEYNEDVATPNPIVGTATLMERDDALTTLTPVEGDWAAFRCSAEGALWVQDYNSDAILADTANMDTNLGTIAGAVAGTEMQVDIVSGTVTTVTSITNDVNIADGGNSITVDWAGTAPPIGAGLEATALRVTIATDSTGVISVDDGGGALTVDGTVTESNSAEILADTANMDTNLASVLSAVQIMDDWDDGSDHCEVVGAAAEDAAVSGAPVLTGGRYDTTARTLDDGDVGALALSAAGEVVAIQQAQYVQHGVERCEVKHFHTVTSTSDTSIITAEASKRFKILSMSIIALSATATNVHLETKTTNTDCFGDSTNPIPIAIDADGDNTAGVVLPWNPGGWFKTADTNEDVAIILSAAQSVLICGSYIAFTP